MLVEPQPTVSSTSTTGSSTGTVVSTRTRARSTPWLSITARTSGPGSTRSPSATAAPTHSGVSDSPGPRRTSTPKSRR
ncbi:MAG: hypothetical protein KF863_15480 [Rubrivivax sp.]|nr:hypothetical protein [Rubrivivax sp.]